jgi:hypothetical protein
MVVRYLTDATAKAFIGAICLVVVLEAAQWAMMLNARKA